MTYPKMFRLRQRFLGPKIDDIPGEVGKQLSRLPLREQITQGQRVAITAGSRGIANIDVILSL